MNTVKVELVTPEKLLFSADVAMVVVPGAEGDFGVLPQHSPLISLLRPGLVTIQEVSGNETKFFVAGGYAEVNNESCTILAEDVIDLGGMTKDKADLHLMQAKKQMSSAVSEEEVAEAARDLKIAEAIVESLSTH